MIGWMTACAAPGEVSPSDTHDAAPAGRATVDDRAAVPPKQVFPSVSINPDRSLGNPKATIAIVEFGDYQCPYCREFHAGTFRQIRTELIDAGKVRYFYKDFPLRSHPHAFAASIMAYCAGAQGRYWEAHDHLYANQARLGTALYTELVAKFGLDAPKIDVCRGSSGARLSVLRDFQEGRHIGVTGTPSFVIGHVEGDRVVVERKATGTPPFEAFAKEIEMLARTEAPAPVRSPAR